MASTVQPIHATLNLCKGDNQSIHKFVFANQVLWITNVVVVFSFKYLPFDIPLKS